MTNAIFYPDLKIVPISHIKLQEYVQKARMKKLAEEIKKEGILRNPPIVTNFFNDSYLHLDGANRITAIQLLRYKYCLVHVVEYSDPSSVRLMSWSHLVGVNQERLMAKIRQISGIVVREINSYSNRYLLRSTVLCILVFQSGHMYEVSSKASYTEVVRKMGELVDAYAECDVERVFSASPWTEKSIRTRFERYTDKNLFVAFPHFSPQQVISLIDRDVLMPAGVTRHVVYRRKLNVNMPLSFLQSTTLEKANDRLQKFLQNRSVRLYEEPIIYFE